MYAKTAMQHSNLADGNYLWQEIHLTLLLSTASQLQALSDESPKQQRTTHHFMLRTYATEAETDKLPLKYMLTGG